MEIIIACDGRPIAKSVAIKGRVGDDRERKFFVPDTIDAEEAAIAAPFTGRTGKH